MPDRHHAPPAPLNLDELFPAGAVSVLSLSTSDSARLLPEEAAAAQSFAPPRLAEFTNGRDCARRALRGLGADASAIPVGAHREPVWPANVVGSISHAGHAAAAVVAWKTQITAIGLDLEPSLPIEAELVPRICRPAERAAILSGGRNPGEMARRFFSMKEAAYKALWPSLRCFLDFHDLEVELGADEMTFTIRSHTGRCPPALAAKLVGRFAQRGDLFASSVVAEV